MTVTGSTTATDSVKLNLPDYLADSDFDQQVLAEIGRVINFRLHGVHNDTVAWLQWMLAGGSRPKANKRAVFADGVNAIRTTQDMLCMALEPYYADFDLNNPTHFVLLERATRPLPATARADELAKTATKS